MDSSNPAVKLFCASKCYFVLYVRQESDYLSFFPLLSLNSLYTQVPIFYVRNVFAVAIF